MSSSVKLPPGCQPPIEVYVNGVLQVEGRDYERRGDELRFDRELAQEGKLGFWRWLIGAFGIGTYRKQETVDVRYQAGGRTLVAHALAVEREDADR